MAKAKFVLPSEIVKKFQNLEKTASEMFEEIAEEGGKVAYQKLLNNLPKGLKQENVIKNIRLSKVYRTPTDGAVNRSVIFVGYFTNRDGKKTPAPLVANMFEYGSSSKPNYPRNRFLKKSFRKADLEEVLNKIYVKYGWDDNE